MAQLQAEIQTLTNQLLDARAEASAARKLARAAEKRAAYATKQVRPLQQQLAATEKAAVTLRQLVAKYMAGTLEQDEKFQNDRRFWDDLVSQDLLQASEPPPTLCVDPMCALHLLCCFSLCCDGGALFVRALCFLVRTAAQRPANETSRWKR